MIILLEVLMGLSLSMCSLFTACILCILWGKVHVKFDKAFRPEPPRIYTKRNVKWK